jgi:hypothetical protein
MTIAAVRQGGAMKFNLGTIVVIVLAIIGLGVFAVAAADIIRWFLNNFWIIFVSGAVILAITIWMKMSSKDDGEDGPF